MRLSLHLVLRTGPRFGSDAVSPDRTGNLGGCALPRRSPGNRLSRRGSRVLYGVAGGGACRRGSRGVRMALRAGSGGDPGGDSASTARADYYATRRAVSTRTGFEPNCSPWTLTALPAPGVRACLSDGGLERPSERETLPPSAFRRRRRARSGGHFSRRVPAAPFRVVVGTTGILEENRPSGRTCNYCAVRCGDLYRQDSMYKASRRTGP